MRVTEIMLDPDDTLVVKSYRTTQKVVIIANSDGNLSVAPLHMDVLGLALSPDDDAWKDDSGRCVK